LEYHRRRKLYLVRGGNKKNFQCKQKLGTHCDIKRKRSVELNSKLHQEINARFGQLSILTTRFTKSPTIASSFANFPTATHRNEGVCDI
jgi:hypothetical protein